MKREGNKCRLKEGSELEEGLVEGEKNQKSGFKRGRRHE